MSPGGVLLWIIFKSGTPAGTIQSGRGQRIRFFPATRAVLVTRQSPATQAVMFTSPG